MKSILIRLLTRVSKFKRDPMLEVKLAVSTDEFVRAFTLLHDAYVDKKLMEKHPSGLRCNIHSFLPHNYVVVVIDKRKNKVVGTVSLILDQLLSIPAEKDFEKEVKTVRELKKNKMVEVSALAIDPEYRNQSHFIQFMLNKFLYLFCKNYIGVDMLVIVVHPRAELFYQSLMGFKPLGEVKEYSFVKGALARFLYLDFSGDFEKKLSKKYLPMKNSFFDYVVNQEDKRLKLELYKNQDIVHRNHYSMIQLMRKAKYEFNELTAFEQKQIASALNLEKNQSMAGLKEYSTLIDYRFEIKINGSIIFHGETFDVELLNISKAGAFIKTAHLSAKIGSRGVLTFMHNGQVQELDFLIKWINKNKSTKLPYGIGVKFEYREFEIFADKAA